MDAAVTVFAKRGLEAAAISEITSLAKLANGTFYYHFTDKAELVDAVAHEVAAALVNQVDDAIRRVESGVERIALATQYFIRLAAAESEWGRIVIQALTDMGEFGTKISRGIRKDIAIAVSQRQLDVEMTDLLITSLLAVVAMALREKLKRPKDQTIEQWAAETLLLILGLSRKEARALPKRVIVKYGDVKVAPSIA